MTTRNLQFLLQPRSIAVVGASDRPRSVGATVFNNLRSGGFSGEIWPVNLRHAEVGGVPAFARVTDLPGAPDLAVLCTPAPAIPGIISDLAAIGTRAAIVLTAGLDATLTPDGRTVTVAMLEAARPALLRILGPNCVGLLVPDLGLNASFAHAPARPGRIAFLSQSGALTTALLDWARDRAIGFSHFISLGNSADVDFGDLLDYLATDPKTDAVMLYMESLTAARKFMSAARRAARNKPVIVVKSGRVAEAAKAAASHTGALAGADAIYDAAFRRAGLLRVNSTRELFDAAETLARLRRPAGARLLIVSNGGGPAVMAVDALIRSGGQLAQLDAATVAQLDAVLPGTWSRANPIDLIGDAPVERYTAALNIVLANPCADALLLIHAPTAIIPPTEIARACAPLLARAPIPILSSWMGGPAVREARFIFNDAGLATYSTPEEGVGAFMHLVQFLCNQELLMQVPPSLAETLRADIPRARQIIDAALHAGRTELSEPEAKDVLSAYQIPVVATRVVRGVDPASDQLTQVALELGFPLVLKILSPQISHKSDVGGVVLDLNSMEQLRAAAAAMIDRCRNARPDAVLEGFTLQPMIRRSDSIELIAGIATDAVFGPVILFGQGGTTVELLDDTALALPPLNLLLANALIARTRISRLLPGYRGRAPIDVQAVAVTLMKLGQLAADLTSVVELDINPLVASPRGVVALDARIKLIRTDDISAARMVIRPYPRELEERIVLRDRSILLRPIRPEDAPRHQDFLARVSPQDLRMRFFYTVRQLPPNQLASLTQIDYDREMVFIALDDHEPSAVRTIGAARACADPDGESAEFALLVQSDQQHQGLGAVLLNKLIRYCRNRGIKQLTGEMLAQNAAMMALAKDCGFKADLSQGGVIRLSLSLGDPLRGTSACRESPP